MRLNLITNEGEYNTHRVYILWNIWREMGSIILRVCVICVSYRWNTWTTERFKEKKILFWRERERTWKEGIGRDKRKDYTYLVKMWVHVPQRGWSWWSDFPWDSITTFPLPLRSWVVKILKHFKNCNWGNVIQIKILTTDN